MGEMEQADQQFRAGRFGQVQGMRTAEETPRLGRAAVTTLKISKESGQFVVDDYRQPGTPAVGRGRTMMDAIGSYFHANQIRLGIIFAVDESARGAETRRRNRELKKR